MPTIALLPTFNHEKYAEVIVSACPANVFAVKKGKAVVVKERDCTTCRECIKLEGVSLEKVKDHFICKTYAMQFRLSPQGYSLLKISS